MFTDTVFFIEDEVIRLKLNRKFQKWHSGGKKGPSKFNILL